MVDLKCNGDPRGYLVAVEGGMHIPFEIKRIFYMYGIDPDVVRAKHANRNSRFCLIAVAGSCKVMVDDGKDRQEFSLDGPCKGLLCEPMTWKEIYGFSADCVLLVLCDTHYDAGEYISDYTEFKKT
jgi:hypothetical protein